jgi:hypothetical protein
MQLVSRSGKSSNLLTITDLLLREAKGANDLLREYKIFMRLIMCIKPPSLRYSCMSKQHARYSQMPWSSSRMVLTRTAHAIAQF